MCSLLQDRLGHRTAPRSTVNHSGPAPPTRRGPTVRQDFIGSPRLPQWRAGVGCRL